MTLPVEKFLKWVKLLNKAIFDTNILDANVRGDIEIKLHSTEIENQKLRNQLKNKLNHKSDAKRNRNRKDKLKATGKTKRAKLEEGCKSP
jgi:hypothetical protein